MVNKLSIVVLCSFLCVSLHSEPAVKKLTGKEIVRKDEGGGGGSSVDAQEAQEAYENQEIEEQSLVLEEQRLKSSAGG